MRRIRPSTARAVLLGISSLFAAPLATLSVGPLAAGFVVPLAAGLAVPLVATPAYAAGTPDSFADLAAKLLPAVVNVSSSQTVTAHNSAPGGGGPGAGPDMPLFPPGSPFEQFFKDFLNRNHPGGQGQGQGGDQQEPERRMQSLGSGFIIDPAGLIVTNNHVIDGADQIAVTFNDGTVLPATVAGRDEKTARQPNQKTREMTTIFGEPRSKGIDTGRPVTEARDNPVYRVLPPPVTSPCRP